VSDSFLCVFVSKTESVLLVRRSIGEGGICEICGFYIFCENSCEFVANLLSFLVSKILLKIQKEFGIIPIIGEGPPKRVRGEPHAKEQPVLLALRSPSGEVGSGFILSFVEVVEGQFHSNLVVNSFILRSNVC
jgi:hypothetical protein